MKLFKILSLFALVTAGANTFAAGYHNIPQELLNKGANEYIVYDPMFDYTKIRDGSNSVLSSMKFYEYTGVDANPMSTSTTSKKLSTTTVRTSSGRSSVSRDLSVGVGEGIVENLTDLAVDADPEIIHRRSGTRLVDSVVVNKAAHKMLLMKNGQIVRSFWIALSNKPQGAKRYEGDKRTPEGTYILDYVKQHSNYYKAFHISYPNASDIDYARKHGRRPGGRIMVHGQPPSKGDYQETVQRSDWTNGCIALLNPDMDIFLQMVDVGTPITINP